MAKAMRPFRDLKAPAWFYAFRTNIIDYWVVHDALPCDVVKCVQGGGGVEL